VLDWRAPANCPAVADVHGQVLRLVGTTLPVKEVLLAHATLSKDETGGWTLTLRTRIGGASGERVLTGNSCRAVTDAAVLTLALTVNPELRLPETVALPAPSSSHNSSHAQTIPSPAVAEQRGVGDTPASWHVYSRVLVGFRSGAAPNLTSEAGLGVGFAYGRVQNWAMASITPAADTPSDAKAGAGAKYWQASLADLVCYSLGSDSMVIAPCVGVDVSRLQGRGYGFDQNRKASVAWYSVAFGAGLVWRLHRDWQVRLDGYGLLALKRPSAFVTSDRTDVLLKPAAIGAQINLGLQFQLW
jgi:hypothetical protein